MKGEGFAKHTWRPPANIPVVPGLTVRSVLCRTGSTSAQ